MAITILTSSQDDFGYYYNLGFLRRGLQEDEIQFEGFVDNHTPEAIDFDNKARVYDFTRSAQSKIREDMTTRLNGVLPGLTVGDCRKIREAFDCLFNYYAYKGYLDRVGQQRAESMKMLIFNEDQYVAHVYFNVTSRRTGLQHFTVTGIALTCQRFTYFPIQETDFAAVLQALQNLHVE